MDQENDFEEILEPMPDCCIYRVPQYLRKINDEAYSPKLISIGPLHYGKKELLGMERQKRRYWSKFGEREDVDAKKLNELETYIVEKEEYIRANYSVTSTFQSPKYVQIILYDAVFIIELFLRNDHGTDDFLLKSPQSVIIKHDLLLLENQLPYFVLSDLYTIAFPNNKEDKSFFVLFLNYIFGKDDLIWFFEELYSQSKHFVDFYRFIFLESKPSKVEPNEDIHDLPCATKLKKSGLEFRGIKGKPLLDISLKKREKYGKWFPLFEVNELQIPTIVVYDGMESMLRNLMAFEMFHYPTETYICHYANLMDHLIDTEKDVDLLVETKIIVNRVGNHEAITKIFNRIVSEMVLSNDSCYNDIAKKIKAHYNYTWNHAKATLRSAYFSNLWTSTATVAATLLLILTLIQTVCSIIQVI